MASGAAQSGSHEVNPQRRPPAHPRAAGRVIEYQAYIDSQLKKTRARVKWVDLWTSLTVLAIGVLGYLLVSVVIDQWIVPGGLGFVGRLLLFLGLTAGIGLHLATRLAPYLWRRVNPVYAAAAIERGQPLKNVLINFLLLRKKPEGVPEPMLEAMKEQAAVRLSTVPGEAPVDRAALIRWGIVLTAVLISAVGYTMFSPKSAFSSIRRVVTPWADVAPPTRVEIVAVSPGDSIRRRDDVVEIRAQVRKMRQGDQAVLYFSATGNPVDDVAVPMTSDDGYEWKAALPPSGGLKQDLFYYVAAVDARSPGYRLKVLATPVINVATVRYEHPAYTGLPPRTVELQGDLRAIEGTRAVITAESNQPILDAFVAFDQSRNRDVVLAPDESKLRAAGGFELALAPDRKTPLHRSYVLRFKNIDGEENPKPVEHKIEVTADQPPELKVVEPTTPPEQELQLAMGSLMRITAEAHDPDFKLAELNVVFEQNNAPLREERLLAEPRSGPANETYIVEPGRLGLKPGARATFRIRAIDNKAPQPNVVESKKYVIVVTAGGQAGRNQQPNQNQPGNPNGQPQAGDRKPQDGNQGKQPPMPGQNAPRQGDPNGGANPDGAQPPQGNAGDQKPGDQKPGDQKPGDQKPGQPKPGAGADGEKTTGKPNEGGEGNPKQPGSAKPGDQGRPGEGGEPKPGEQEPIDPNADPSRTLDRLMQHFNKKDGKPEKPQDDRQMADRGQPNERPQPGEQKPGEQVRPGEQQPGEQKPTEQKPGEQKQPGENSPPDQGRPMPREGATPDGAKPDGAKPDGAKPDGANQTDTKPEGTKPDGTKPDGSQPEAGANQQGPKPDGSRPGEAKPDGMKPDGAGKPEGDQPQTGGNQPMANQPNGGPQGGNEKPGDQKPGSQNGGASNDQKSGGNQSGGSQSGGNQNAPAQNTGGTPAGEQPGAGDAAGSKPGSKPGTPGEAQHKTDDRAGQAERRDGAGMNDNGTEKKPGAASENGQPTPGTEQGKPSNPGDSGATGGTGSKPDSQSQQPKPGEAKPSANEGQPAGNQKGSGGASGESKSEPGTPAAQEMNKPRDKPGSEQTGRGQESPGEEAKSPSGSRSESSGKSDNAGDRSGEGQKGGGQKSPQQGTGAAGSSTSADQGAGAAPDQGDSATSSQGGDKKPAGRQTGGESSGRTGPGSQSREGGSEPGGTTGSAGSGRRDATDNPNRPGEVDRSGGGGSAAGNRIATGSPGSPPSGGDPANLEFTEEATDLTLSRLKQQLAQGEVDPEILKMFGSREAAAEFLRQFEALKAAAGQAGPQGDAARRQYEQVLRGMGLQSRSVDRRGGARDDDSRGLTGARRTEPPAKYADRYGAYSRSIGQDEQPKK